jgi:hypothetical protein
LQRQSALSAAADHSAEKIGRQEKAPPQKAWAAMSARPNVGKTSVACIEMAHEAILSVYLRSTWAKLPATFE